MRILKDIQVKKELFKKVFLYGLAFFVSFTLIGEIFTRIFASMSAKAGLMDIAELTEANVEQLAVQAEGLYSILLAIIVLFVFFLIIQLYNYSFFENLIWNTIFKKKTTFRNTNRFFGLNILLTIIFTILLLVIFLIIAKLPVSLMTIGTVLFVLAVLFSVYLVYTGYISFGKTHEILRSIKNVYLIGIKRLDLTIMPLVAAVVIGILLNIVLLLFMSLPAVVNTMIQAAAFAAYLAWFRLYFAKVLKSVKL